MFQLDRNRLKSREITKKNVTVGVTTDTTQLWAKVPSQELSDALAEAFKDELKE